jgi:hypothetical protein
VVMNLTVFTGNAAILRLELLAAVATDFFGPALEVVSEGSN